jgi:hypothetical protein
MRIAITEFAVIAVIAVISRDRRHLSLGTTL